MKTIKQLADELGVSKQAINKKIDNLGCRQQLMKIDNHYEIPESIEKSIKSTFSQQPNPTTVDSNSSQLIATLVDDLREQLKTKDEQISSLQKLLDQQQQLHMADKQKLLEIEEKQAEPKEQKETGFFKKIFKTQ